MLEIWQLYNSKVSHIILALTFLGVQCARALEVLTRMREDSIQEI